MKITFHGGVGEVTGSNFLLTSASGEKTLIDVGLHQGSGQFEKNLKAFPYDPSGIKNVIITHAHLDHIGLLPKLIRHGFIGEIYGTKETKELSEIMLPDALKIISADLRKRSLPDLYSEEDIRKTISLWKIKEYEEEFKLGEPLTAVLRNAGHILGSAMVEIKDEVGKKILFTGDIGNEPSILLSPPSVPENINIMIMESVYGDRLHDKIEKRKEDLIRIVKETFNLKKTLIIPSFSIERTQVILHELDTLLSEGKIPDMPVFLDSPLASKATAIYKNSIHRFSQKINDGIKDGNDFLQFPKLRITESSFESKAIEKIHPPKIILAGSGMSEGGRVVGHEKTFLPDPNATILLVGYQAVGTLGRLLQDKAKKVSIGGENVSIKAKIESISGYSGHKDRDGLLQFAENVREKSGGKLEKIFVVMGEPKASMFLAQRIRDYIGVEAVVPEEGEEVNM